MIKLIATVFGKVALLYLLLVVVWSDLVLIMVATPRLIFDPQPFIQSVGLAIAVAAVVSARAKSLTPFLWTFFCLAYTSLFLFFSHYAFRFLAFFSLVGAISFLYRSKFTEPLLVLLPIISGAWLFLTLVYSPYLVGWVYYVTGQRDFAGALYQGLASLMHGYFYVANVLPLLAMFFLGKQGYVKLYSIYQARRPNPSNNTNAAR